LREYNTLHENRRMYSFVSDWIKGRRELALNGSCQSKDTCL
jgi:hypothetical protein